MARPLSPYPLPLELSVQVQIELRVLDPIPYFEKAQIRIQLRNSEKLYLSRSIRFVYYLMLHKS